MDPGSVQLLSATPRGFMDRNTPPPYPHLSTMLFPHIHYPALLAQQAQLLHREKSAFSPIIGGFNKTSTNVSPATPPSPPLDSPPHAATEADRLPPRFSAVQVTSPSSMSSLNMASPLSSLPGFNQALLMRHWLSTNAGQASPSFYPTRETETK